MAEQYPELKFEDSIAKPWFPIPIIKHAVFVPVQEGFPTHIRPEWDDTGLSPQVFIGSWYAMLSEDGMSVRYGSARDQWENMHTKVPMNDRHPGGWVKTLVPTGYHTQEILDVVTLIDDDDQPNGYREARKTVTAGTLVLKQPGGEIQHVRPSDEASTYFTQEQARMLNLAYLDVMSGQFASWAIANAVEQTAVSNSRNLPELFEKVQV